MALKTFSLGIIYHAFANTPQYQSANQEMCSFTHSKDMTEAPKFKKTGHATLTTPIRGSLSTQG